MVRLISGRNSPTYSAGIENPFEDVQATGTAVLDIHNQRIAQARDDHDDIRLGVLIRNMEAQEITLFERTIGPVATSNYEWRRSTWDNLEAYRDDRHTYTYTWQPHGSQFTILERVPPGATRFRIAHEVSMLEMAHVLELTRFELEWVEKIDQKDVD